MADCSSSPQSAYVPVSWLISLILHYFEVGKTDPQEWLFPCLIFLNLGKCDHRASLAMFPSPKKGIHYETQGQLGSLQFHGMEWKQDRPMWVEEVLLGSKSNFGLPDTMMLPSNPAQGHSQPGKGDPSPKVCQSDSLPQRGSRMHRALNCTSSQQLRNFMQVHELPMFLFPHLEHGSNNNNSDLIRWLFGLFKKTTHL